MAVIQERKALPLLVPLARSPGGSDTCLSCLFPNLGLSCASLGPGLIKAPCRESRGWLT